MKLVYFFFLLSFTGFSQHFITREKGKDFFFTENKGQIHDQNFNSVPDVIFSGNDQNSIFHLKKGGISYQLYSISRTENENMMLQHKNRFDLGGLTLGKTTIYRIDIQWVNANINANVSGIGPKNDYTNYYSPSCLNGALEVKKYDAVIYEKIYNGIDLKWYQKDGHLKYDFIVAPFANYQDIKIEIQGSSEIILEDDGSVKIVTPIGDIREGAPLVLQEGKTIKSKWKLKNNVLSFEIDHYDHSKHLVIDPNVATRVWGTYNGGGGQDWNYSNSVDGAGNVYLFGSTQSLNSIATTGAYQTSLVNNYDAFISKFDNNGNRIWGTYYGGNLEDWSDGGCIDINGHVFICGRTKSTSGISTPGSHQPQYTAMYDAFLAKFDPNGFREWGTYYGDTAVDIGYACATDVSGNVYLTGRADVANVTSTVFATPGAFQPSAPALSSTAFLAKFSSSGTRLWSTYYGAHPNWTQGNACVVDKNNNIYIAGATTSSNTILASPGAHQPISGGGTYEAFLAKFDNSGTRLWGTFYGGAGDEYGNGCAVDSVGNVYLCGETASSHGNTIATPGAHKTANLIGWDAFLVKFTGGGVRIWSTYYGGGEQDRAYGCCTNLAGDVFIAGSAESSNGIATYGTHQTLKYNVGTNQTGFFAKFNSNGVRQWGSYYGGNIYELAYSIKSDFNGNLFVSGTTWSNNYITTTGCHQPTHGGGSTDAFLAKFIDCTTLNAPGPISGNTGKCTGIAESYSIAPVPGATSYSWFMPSGWIGSSTSNTISVIPMSAGSLSVIASNTCGPSDYSVLNLNALLAPTIALTNTQVCSGSTFTMTPFGAMTYTYSNGSAVITPTVNSTYSVMGTGINGCVSISSGVLTVTVLPTPTIVVNNGAICSGDSFTLMPSGASSYTFVNGSSIVSPTVTSTFSVIGTATNGCISQTPGLSTVIVNPLPTLAINSATICFGDSITLVPSGALTYTFSNGTSVVSPSITTSYSVSGTDSAGCLSGMPAIATITVYSLPVISANGGSICAGSSFTMTPSGATTYSFTSGIAVVSPTSTSNYSITGIDSLGCVSQAIALTITVNPIPLLIISSTDSLICVGQSATLTALGATTYSWNNGSTGNTIVISPSVSTTYIVTGNDLNNCSASSVITQSVDLCTGVEMSSFIESVKIYPNPNNGNFTIESSKPVRVIIYNAIGQIVYFTHDNLKVSTISLKNFAQGIYFIELIENNNVTYTKLKIVKSE